MPRYLVLLGAGVSAFAAAFYIRDTLKGRTQPNRVTFLIWGLAPLIATAAGLAKGVTWAVVPVFMSGFCPLLIFASSFSSPKAYWRLTTFDYACGACSILALVLWGITRRPEVAIVFAILSDVLAAVPTLKKSWSHPETETASVYLGGFFSALTAFAALRTWSFAEWAFPSYLIAMNISISLLLFRRRGNEAFPRPGR